MKAFVLDPPRCTGCEACRVACSIENRIPMERTWRSVHHTNLEHRPGLPAFHLSMACNHCARPACLAGCPATAYAKDPATGAVLLDDSRCIGCRYCSWVCPYDAPRFDPFQGVMGKCTFCFDRILVGQAPACASACPTGALGVEERAAPLPEPEFPGIFIGTLGPALRIEQASIPFAPAMAPGDPDTVAGFEPGPPPPAKVSLRSEWTLWLFTLAALGLVGLHLGWVLGGPAWLPPWGVLALGGLAAALSTAHLGRPERAWRAVVNPRHSWLSREVLAFGTFLPAAALSLLLGRHGVLAWVGAALGILLLGSMDRLYQVAEHRPMWRLRSSDLLPAGLHLAALVAGAWPALGLLAVLRAALFLHGAWRGRPALGPPALVARLLALGLPLLPLALGIPAWARLVCFLAGEALDRAGFYDGLEIPSPAALLHRRGAGFTSASADPA